MTTSSPDTAPPFTLPPGIEVRHLVDAFDKAELLRGDVRDRNTRLVVRFEQAADTLAISTKHLSKMARLDALAELRQVRAQSFLTFLSDGDFAWVAERAAERAATNAGAR